MAEIWQAIERLPVDLKMALLLRDVAGLRYTEIADTLDINLATVKWRIFQARDEVRSPSPQRTNAPGLSPSGRRGDD